jgi:acetolactate synthase regulatory subunit
MEIKRLLELEKLMQKTLLEHETTVSALDQRTKELQAMTLQYQAMKLNHDTIKTQQIETSKQCVALQKQLNQYEQDQIKMKKDLAQQDKTMKAHDETVAKMKLEINTLTEDNTLTKQKNIELIAQVSTLLTDIKELKQCIEEEHNRNKNDTVGGDKVDDSKNTHEELTMLQNQLQKAMDDCKLMDTKVQQLEEIREGYRITIEELKKENVQVQNLHEKCVVAHEHKEKEYRANELQFTATQKSLTITIENLQQQLLSKTTDGDGAAATADSSGLLQEMKDDLEAKHQATNALRELCTSLQTQLDELTVSHQHVLNELEQKKLNLIISEEHHSEEIQKNKMSFNAVVDEYKTKNILIMNELEQYREESKEHINTIQQLERTIDTLSNQLGSLVDSGEVFEKNAQHREENLVQQITRLRKGRKKDRLVYKTAVDASNAWRIRAENAESMLADQQASSSSRNVKTTTSGGRGMASKRKVVRPTPPMETTTSGTASGGSNGGNGTSKRRNRKYVSSQHNNSLPPVSSASPLKEAPA